MKTILITGGAGFIGSNFAHLIASKYPEYQIIIIDKLNQQGRRENLKDIEDKIQFHQFDLIDFKKLEDIFSQNKINYVAHFAAETNVDRSIENPMEFVNSNIIATQNLLSLSRKYQVERFHHVSTDEVFGELLTEAREFYQKVGKVYCPALKADVVFNSDGFHHLRYNSSRVNRTKPEQRNKLAYIAQATDPRHRPLCPRPRHRGRRAPRHQAVLQ
jgi:nucleoside-diphosphate-sugar epimerase